MTQNSSSELREQLEEFALHMKPGTTKGKHRTAIFDTVELTKLVEHLIAQDRLELLKRIELEVNKAKMTEWKSDPQTAADGSTVVFDNTSDEAKAHNQALSEIAAIINAIRESI